MAKTYTIRITTTEAYYKITLIGKSSIEAKDEIVKNLEGAIVGDIIDIEIDDNENRTTGI